MEPLTVEIVRGEMVESRHRVAGVAMDAAGHPLFEAGETNALVYPRSAIKPLQAIVLVETGAAEAFSLSDAEIAIATASHGGEPRHVATVLAWLARLGLGESDLECGAHPPSDPTAALALARSGALPSQLHNNCSGKHAGFLTVARHLGAPTRGYIGPDHPSQLRALATVFEMASARLDGAPRGIDGCGIPIAALPLRALARAFARFADPAGLTAPRRQAIERIRAAMAAEPVLVAGSGRFTTRLIEATAGAVLVKEGAEGVYAAAWPAGGIGIALKVADGAGRAAAVAMGHVLARLGALGGAEATLSDALAPVLYNHAGRPVGSIRVSV
jgi:L-asparaginase II